MKIAGLIIGILLTCLSGLVFVVFLILPSFTNNHVSRKESMMGLIPAVIVFVVGLLITVVFGILVVARRRSAS